MTDDRFIIINSAADLLQACRDAETYDKWPVIVVTDESSTNHIINKSYSQFQTDSEQILTKIFVNCQY